MIRRFEISCRILWILKWILNPSHKMLIIIFYLQNYWMKFRTFNFDLIFCFVRYPLEYFCILVWILNGCNFSVRNGKADYLYLYLVGYMVKKDHLWVERLCLCVIIDLKFVVLTSVSTNFRHSFREQQSKFPKQLYKCKMGQNQLWTDVFYLWNLQIMGIQRSKRSNVCILMAIYQNQNFL